VQSIVLGIITGLYVMVVAAAQRDGAWPDFSYWLLVITSSAVSTSIARCVLRAEAKTNNLALRAVLLHRALTVCVGDT